MLFLSLLGQDVEVTVHEAPRGRRRGTVRTRRGKIRKRSLANLTFIQPISLVAMSTKERPVRAMDLAKAVFAEE